MNNTLELYARQQLIDGLKRCTEDQFNLFKRMYAHEHINDWGVEETVAAMPEEKLDRAMEQVEMTLKKLNKR